MLIRAGYEISYDCAQTTPMLLLLSIVPDREPDLRTPQRMSLTSSSGEPVPVRHYRDGFNNAVTRVVAPPGRLTISADFLIEDSGLHDPAVPDAEQHRIADLPDEVLVFLLGSRYCETDKLSDQAWSLFGHTRPGWERVQAICDHVHDRITFGYEHARSTKTAFEANEERKGVCRDFTHLAVTYCRCMNIPTRYVTGYLGDIGVPPVDYPMDFSAWFEVYLGGRWHTFDARHNTPRIGRILMGRGRDATDVAISTAFGSARLSGFHVITDEVKDEAAALAAVKA
ncbi:transglutaminase-like domain-containing protein [Roseomonas sp. BN140053]|uniref:transglutaminase-like domain-containing protein n=1 Tax=Roseomonas sp. BN140053 TaxID=3391898 RepID=UPI0039ECA652